LYNNNWENEEVDQWKRVRLTAKVHVNLMYDNKLSPSESCPLDFTCSEVLFFAEDIQLCY